MTPTFRSIRRAGMWVVLIATVAVTTSCSSCDGSSVPCPQNPCGPGEVCDEGTCVAQSSCEGGCSKGQICQDGTCVWDGGQCSKAGESCDPNGPTNVGYVCVPWTGDPREATCATVCGDDSCPSGSACVILQSRQPRSCSSDDDCPTDAICRSGTCQYAACRPSECGGFFVGDKACQEQFGDLPTRYPNGAKCYEFQNDANFCMPAGRRERGDSCIPIRQAIRNDSFGQTCGRGLACLNGSCVKACQKNSQCPGDEKCLAVEETVVQPGVGRCASGCEPFSEEACGSNETCKPVGGGRGECIEAGGRGAYAACEPGENQCEKGTVCVVYQQGSVRAGTDTIARCHHLCDVRAGKRNDDGTLDDEAQARRDATCPQPDPAPASVRFVHGARGAGPLDVYRSGKSMPLATGLAEGAASEASGDRTFFQMSAGKYDFAARSQGAPRTDVPLAEVVQRLGPGDARILTLAAPSPGSGAEVQIAAVAAAEVASFESGETGLRVVHTVADARRLDVVAVPAGSGLGDASRRTELAAGLKFGEAGPTQSLSTGSYDVYAFPVGADRSDPSNALLSHAGISLQTRSSLYLHGTTDPTDDYRTDPAYLVEAVPAPSNRGGRPPTRCIEHTSGNYGYCQQRCPNGPADYSRDNCRGDRMGCRPIRRSDRQMREHLCAPVGDGAVGDPCNTIAQYGECREGNYCLEYGNTREGYEPGDPRGVCQSLCATDETPSTKLRCGAETTCRPLTRQRDLGVGQCGFPCSPNRKYADPQSCPKGLRSCNPVASLRPNLSGQGTAPSVRPEQAFCSASGDIAPGQRCRARNCRPRAECLYPRSQQNSLVDTLLSPYVGGSGGTAKCRLHCDPFDADDSAHRCGDGETCLFNYPWSAEVGHCASIASTKKPGASCDSPGLSCGEDSICVQQGGSSTCMRFCDYEGPDASGNLRQSTCPGGYRCHPYIRDIGVCRR